MNKSYSKSRDSDFILFLASISVAFSVFFAFLYASQPPLDAHSFRQTQTALTAYWILQNGFKLAYETPVAGPAWSIPFEFPIYQFLIATVSKFLNAPLDFVGRIVSYIFLILCLIPIKSITRIIRLSESVFYIFVTILFSTPVYIYWGRTIMIETTALFFAIAAIKYFIEFLIEGYSHQTLWLYIIFITLSVLQKATTGFPVLIVLTLIFIVNEVKKAGSINRFVLSKQILLYLICFAIPAVIGITWVLYTDHVKSLNLFGLQITSSDLNKWNWGSLKQRLSYDLFVDVLWKRIFVTNLGGIFGVAVLLLSFYIKFEYRIKVIIFISLVLGILPLFLFTNLHIIHDYYQSANLIFFVYAVSVALGGILVPSISIRTKILVPSLFIILSSNYIVVAIIYLPQAKAVFTKINSRDYAIGEILKREVSPKDQFVAFGNDWSSSLAYISQRKSFTVPGWFKSYEEVATHPENFVDKDHLGAVVSCSVRNPSIVSLLNWSSNNRTWKIGESHGCYIATPQKLLKIIDPILKQCRGNIDRSVVENREGMKIIIFSGWSIMSGKDNIIPDNVYITLSKQGNKTIYLETLKVPRPDINGYFGISDKFDTGFSRIVYADLPLGQYSVGILQSNKNGFEVCQFQKRLTLKKINQSTK